MNPADEKPAAVKPGADTSFSEYAAGLGEGSFPLANALRVHMNITDLDNDLRTRAQFDAELKKLMGEDK